MTAADFISRAEAQRASADEAEGRIALNAETCEACGTPAAWRAFGWARYRCEPCKVRYVQHAGAFASVAVWLPLSSPLVPLRSPSGEVVAYATERDVQELGLGSIGGAR